MFAAPLVPTSTTTSTTSTHTQRSRPSRLRGFSYLRNYTQNHLSSSSHSSQSNSPTSPTGTGSGALTRFVSSPAAAGGRSTTPPSQSQANNSESDHSGPASGEEASNGMARKLRGAAATGTGSGSGATAATPSGANGSLLDIRRTQSENGPSVLDGGTIPSLGAIAADRGNASAAETTSGLTGLPPDQMPTIRFIPYQDPRSNKPSLAFSTTSRTLPHEDCVIRVGRYSERDVNSNPPANVPSSAPVGFKSKVVSRRHCEFWCSQGQWYIKDVKSSSGTFLNHIRLSQPGIESRPFPVNDGDVVQLGIDFRGGEEQIFRCVKIRIECNRAWQKGLNSFNMTTHKRLRALGGARADTDNNSNHSSECSICLMSIAPCQSLFVAPCSHVWHFRCIRPILNDPKNYPQFLCPNCRAVADLEADIDDAGAAAWHDGPNSSSSDLGHHDAGTGDADLAAAIAASLQNTHIASADEATPTTASPPIVRGRDTIALPQPMASPNLSTSIGAALHDTAPLASPPALPGAASDHRSHLPQSGSEGPLTPRNDAGPFIFDGSGGRGQTASAS